MAEIAGAIISNARSDAIVAAIERQTTIMTELVAVTRAETRAMNTNVGAAIFPQGSEGAAGGEVPVAFAADPPAP